MTLPNFLCVGAQKSGTTSLHNILIQHPDIYLPSRKETKFFIDDSKFTRGISYYESKFFGEWKGEKAVGEIDPDYMFFEYVPERIYKFLGDSVKLIFFLRNPVDRAYSHYLMSRGRGIEELSFPEAVKIEKDRIKKGFFYKTHFSYITRGYYSEQIKRFLKYFSKKNMFFVVFESDFIQKKEEMFSKLLTFLGVSSEVNIDLNIKSNAAFESRFPFLSRIIHEKPKWAKYLAKVIIPNREIKRRFAKTLDSVNKKPIVKQELSLEEKRTLFKAFFEEETRKLEELLNLDLNIWRSF